MSKLLYLSNNVVTELVDPADVLRIAEETLRAHARDEIAWATPRMLTIRDERIPALFRAKLVGIASGAAQYLERAGDRRERIAQFVRKRREEHVHAPVGHLS